MSLLIGYVSSNYSFIMSDGRATGAMASECYDKTFKLKDNIIGGYVGVAEDINQILTELCRIQFDNADEAAGTIQAMLGEKPEHIPFDSDITLIGKNTKGKLCVYLIGKSTELKVNRTDASSLSDFFYPIGGSIPREEIAKIINHLCKEKSLSPYDKAKAMIEEVAKSDMTVNTNVFVQKLRLNPTI